jgi:hypothetical protein
MMRTLLIATCEIATCEIATCVIATCTIATCVVATRAAAEPYAASGQVGYLQEWELKASLAKTTSGGRVEYSGPVTLRHVGLCSVNGVEAKFGNMRLTMSRAPGAAEGTLAMEGDSCRIVATKVPSYSGLLTCRNGQGVPISFSIEETAAGTSTPGTSTSGTAAADTAAADTAAAGAVAPGNAPGAGK